MGTALQSLSPATNILKQHPRFIAVVFAIQALVLLSTAILAIIPGGSLITSFVIFPAMIVTLTGLSYTALKHNRIDLADAKLAVKTHLIDVAGAYLIVTAILLIGTLIYAIITGIISLIVYLALPISSASLTGLSTGTLAVIAIIGGILALIYLALYLLAFAVMQFLDVAAIMHNADHTEAIKTSWNTLTTYPVSVSGYLTIRGTLQFLSSAIPIALIATGALFETLALVAIGVLFLVTLSPLLGAFAHIYHVVYFDAIGPVPQTEFDNELETAVPLDYPPDSESNPETPNGAIAEDLP